MKNREKKNVEKTYENCMFVCVFELGMCMYQFEFIISFVVAIDSSVLVSEHRIFHNVFMKNLM